MASVELGSGPKAGMNIAEGATDISSGDATRTLGSFNSGGGSAIEGHSEEGTAVVGISNHSVGVQAISRGSANALEASAQGDGNAAVFFGKVGALGDLEVNGLLQGRTIDDIFYNIDLLWDVVRGLGAVMGPPGHQ
jgi:hypothetical protein